MARTTKRRWAVAGTGAAVVGALMLMLFRGVGGAPLAPAKAPPRPTVTVVSQRDVAVNDESVLLDPMPLFLPTKWNATQREIPAPEPGGRFQGYDTPRLAFAENELKLGLSDPISVPAGPAKAVTEDAVAAPLVGFGRLDTPVVAPKARGAFVEIVEASTGRTVWSDQIVEAPEGKGLWQPLEFMARVDPAGLVGPLVVTTRSGVEEVDGFFAKYLARTLRVGERLAPGFYRISVGP
ncbi:MAG: hypothetical protein NTV51_32590 [Verrucomicrobia bacterium]|nr:hypothetical protein [Verrucomicrobiota bacterium]